MSAWSMLASAFCRGRRVPRTGFKTLTSKIGPRTFYKGKGCAPTGRHTRKGRQAEGGPPLPPPLGDPLSPPQQPLTPIFASCSQADTLSSPGGCLSTFCPT